MIEIKLKDIADRLGKNITDIARETGLNRNTVTDLYHGKVDGIKFSTIDIVCDTYGISLSDLITRKELRIGAAPASQIIREVRSASPFFSWQMLNALHKPSSQYFENGIGNIYAFFVRDGAEFFFDRREVTRAAKRIYQRYSHEGLTKVHTAFMSARDQLMASINGLSDQPLEQFLSVDLIKTFQRLSDLFADMLSVSAWIDLFDFGVREEMVQQLQNAHHFTASESSLLLASGEMTSSVTRRLALLQLPKTFIETKPVSISREQCKTFIVEHRDAKRFTNQYPFMDEGVLVESIEAYVSDRALLVRETEVLAHLPRQHAEAVKTVLRAHGMRINPLAFFAELAVWRDEREEVSQHVCFQMERIRRILANRFHIAFSFTSYLLPQELQHVQNGLVTERTLEHRCRQGMLITLQHGEYHVSEGERAVSVQDDLMSRYMSQLAYEDVS